MGEVDQRRRVPKGPRQPRQQLPQVARVGLDGVGGQRLLVHHVAEPRAERCAHVLGGRRGGVLKQKIRGMRAIGHGFA